jgi:hypothetical protein
MECLGVALFWIATAIAALAAAVAIVGLYFGDGVDRFLIDGLIAAFGATIWFIGLACRKALSADASIRRRRVG